MVKVRKKSKQSRKPSVLAQLKRENVVLIQILNGLLLRFGHPMKDAIETICRMPEEALPVNWELDNKTRELRLWLLYPEHEAAEAEAEPAPTPDEDEDLEEFAANLRGSERSDDETEAT